MKILVSVVICCILAAALVWTKPVVEADCDSTVAELKTILGEDGEKFARRLNASAFYEANSTQDLQELLEKITEIGEFHRKLILMEQEIANSTDDDQITRYVDQYMRSIEQFRAKVLNGKDDDQVYKWTTKLGRQYDKGLFELIDRAKTACYDTEN